MSAPSAPRSLVATAGNASVKLTWVVPLSTGGTAIDRYAVQRASSSAGPWTNVAFPTTTAHTVTGLTNGVRYYFRVVAHNVVGWGPASTVVNAIPRTVPSVPRSLVATPGNASVKLTWVVPLSTGGTAIDRYAVQRASSSAGPWTNVAFPTTTAHTVTGLTNGVRYYFRVVAHNVVGWGPASTAVNAIPRTVPSAPRSLVATNGNRTVALVWQAPASIGGAAIDRYEVQRATTSTGPWTSLATPTGRTYTAVGLTNGRVYYFRVRAHNAAGWGAFTPSVVGSPVGPPTAPRNPQGTLSSRDIIVVTWEAPLTNGGHPIASYEVEVSTDALQWSHYSAVPATRLRAIFGFDDRPGPYYFRIRASNVLGWGPYSVAVRVATQPGPVRAVSASPGAMSATVTWQPPLKDGGSPITGYAVTVDSCAGEVVLTRVVTSTSLQIGGLTDGQRYCIRVRARNAHGQSSGSVESEAFVTPGQPTAPRSCSSSVVRWPDGRRDLTITWTAPGTFGGYRLEHYAVRIYRNGVAVLSLATAQLSQVVPSVGSGVYHATVQAQNTAGLIGPTCTTSSVTIP